MVLEENRQLEILNMNYEKLKDDKKDMLLKVGEKLLDIQNLVKTDIKKGKTHEENL